MLHNAVVRRQKWGPSERDLVLVCGLAPGRYGSYFPCSFTDHLERFDSFADRQNRLTGTSVDQRFR
jgi:hypothetical protein